MKLFSQTQSAGATTPLAHPLVRRVWPCAALAALILLFFNKIALSNLILARGDTFLYFYPYWTAAAEALRAGRLPLWNPDLFMGAPFLANSQVGLFYPPNWLAWWLLPAPYAVSATILVHLFIAGAGTYLAARRCLRLNQSAALVAAVLFALGGYLTAQVEHVNQLQGLAWMPWIFATLPLCAKEGGRAEVIRKASLRFAWFFTLQLLAGHAQTTFITGVGVLIWLLAEFAFQRLSAAGDFALRFMFFYRRFWGRLPASLALGAAIALLVSAVQLLPTFELIGNSTRQGGLAASEALSFSLHPLLIARALLPHYDQSLFTEYIAFLPVTALMLAMLGAWQWRTWQGALPAIALVACALLLALGRFNPLSWLLVNLPGFDAFRVPARWLALYAFGVALLAGLGWQLVFDRWLLRSRRWPDVPPRARDNLWHVQRPMRAAMLLVAGLMLWSLVATILAIFVPTGPEAPYQSPNPASTIGWLLELLLVTMLVTGLRPVLSRADRFRPRVAQAKPRSPVPLAAVGLLVMFAASRAHPYNNPTTPEAFFDLRPSVARLLVESECTLIPGDCPAPPGRLLSLSDILFDPGDLSEINSIYADQLQATALYDYTIAVKQKEIIAPNLSLAFGLSAIDGFDGGILPLRAYSQLTGLLLPDGELSIDGRLREYMRALPEERWLDLFNARFVITDKVGDTWRQDVFFDLQHPVDLGAGETLEVGFIPAFEATELWILAESLPGAAEVTSDEGEFWSIQAEPLADDLFRLPFPSPTRPAAVTLHACQPPAGTPCRIHGLTLVDRRDGAFHSLVPGNNRLVHSGDVKIYENLDLLPRAFLVREWQWEPNVTDSVAAMQVTAFDPRQSAVLVGEGDNRSTDGQAATDESVTISTYDPERVVIRTRAEAVRLLLLTDAFYPGWQVTIDGTPSTIYQADALFRGVFVPAGSHEVVFAFRPRSVDWGRTISLAGIALWMILLIAPRPRRP